MAQFPAVIALSSLDGANGFELPGEAAGDRSGFSVSSAGDLDGDGFDDVIVGSRRADSYAGASYVVFGKAVGFSPTLELSSLDGANGFEINGESSSDYSGFSVSSAGDVNSDGFDDVVVGAPDSNGSYAGASYVVFGKAGAFSSKLALSSLDGRNGFQIDGESNGDRSGGSVSSAGDVNGDGFDDVIIGATRNGSFAGASYVVFGKAGGLSPALALSSLNGANGFVIEGEARSDGSGISVSSAGDVNGDGFDDVIVGADRANPNGRGSGASYVVFGKAGDFSPTLALSSLDGSNGFQIDGAAASDLSGVSVSSAGDVNGDGFDDVIIAAEGANRTPDPRGDIFPEFSGAAYVVFGKVGGFLPTLALSSLDGVNGFEIQREPGSPGRIGSVSSAGDVNGDGFDDVIVGAAYAEPNGYGSGASYVVFGKAGGFSPTLALSSLDGRNGFKIEGEAAIDFSGRSVSSAGDVNGDGFDDVIVGADGADPSGNHSGASFVVFGRAPDAAVVRIGSNADQTLAGGAFDDRLSGLNGDDRLLGGAGADLLNGGRGADAMTGGAGDDRYIADNLGDTIVEAANGGTDTVVSTISRTLANNVENLILVGPAAVGGVGNALDNLIVGNAAANVLRGGAGADTMSGREGDDRYAVDDIDDRVVEAADGGTDTVLSTISEILGANVENLIQGGARAVNGFGNALANAIDGNLARNFLNGGLGADRLTGGAGDDVFLFTTALGAGNVDDIGDFAAGADRIRLDDAVFAGLATGALAAQAFRTGAAAADPDDRIIYDDATGDLFFDRDGTGAAAQIRFATLDDGLLLTSRDFFVI